MIYMADLINAFHIMKNKQNVQNIDHFFTQRSTIKEKEVIDKQMNRKIKKVKVVDNYLGIIMPINMEDDDIEKPVGFDIEIFGDNMYHFKGTMIAHQGVCPNFMEKIGGIKKIFVNINYKFEVNNTKLCENETSTTSYVYKRYSNFIDVPKRFQSDSLEINNEEIENI